MNNVIYKALFTLWIINQGVLCEKMIKILIYCKNLQISRTIFPKIVAKKLGVRLICRNIWKRCAIFAYNLMPGY